MISIAPEPVQDTLELPDPAPRPEVPPPRPSPSEEGEFKRADDDEIAKQVLYDISEKGDLVYTEGEFWRYRPEKGIFTLARREGLRNYIARYSGWHWLDADKKVIHLALRQSRLDAIYKRMADLIGDEKFFERRQVCLVFQNCAILLQDRKLIAAPFSREHRARHQIDCDWDPKAVAPKFKEVCDSIFAGDADSEAKQDLLAEGLGSAFGGVGAKHKTAFLLAGTGKGNNGKSTLLEIFEGLFAPEARCCVPPNRMTSISSALANMAGKYLNVDADIDTARLGVESGLVRGLISGDPRTAPRKYKDDLTFRNHSTSFFGTNGIGAPTDDAFAALGRYCLITCNNRLSPNPSETDLKAGVLKVDPDAKEHILAHERCGVIIWALRGLVRLEARGGYPVLQSALDKATEVRIEHDSLLAWLDGSGVQITAAAGEEVPPLGTGRTPSVAAYQHYREWARNGDFKNLLTITTFGRRIKEHVAHVRSDGSYYGISLPHRVLTETVEEIRKEASDQARFLRNRRDHLPPNERN